MCYSCKAFSPAESSSQSPKEAAHPARYEADETPMVEYLNASNVVEQRRRAAREASGQGPRTIVRCPSPATFSS